MRNILSNGPNILTAFTIDGAWENLRSMMERIREDEASASLVEIKEIILSPCCDEMVGRVWRIAQGHAETAFVIAFLAPHCDPELTSFADVIPKMMKRH